MVSCIMKRDLKEFGEEIFKGAYVTEDKACCSDSLLVESLSIIAMAFFSCFRQTKGNQSQTKIGLHLTFPIGFKLLLVLSYCLGKQESVLEFVDDQF